MNKIFLTESQLEKLQKLMEDSRDKSLLPYMNNVKNKINESDIITQTINEIINEEISINSEYDNRLDDTLLKSLKICNSQSE